MASITTSGRAALLALTLVACARPHVAPLAPPAYLAEVPANYDRTWTALVRALARENLPLRAIARDSGVIASDDVVSPIGLWADCGVISDDRIEGEAVVSFTVFAEPNGRTTRLQVNSKMRTHAHRRGGSGKLRSSPVYPCASTGRFEGNLLEAVRGLTAAE